MTTRKPFGELSKSQKNRRLKRDNNGSLLQQIPSPLLTRHDVNIFSDDKQDTADCTSFNFTLPESSIEHQDDIISDDNDVDFTQMGINCERCQCWLFSAKKIIDSDTTIDLRTQIGRWQCQYNISQAATGSLLKMLVNVNSVDELKKLPKDSRTLLNTPQTTVIRSVEPGEYFHYGLERGLIDQLKSIGIDEFEKNILINFHIDELPISKSSKRQLYPILAEVFPKIATPFVIGIYHGFNKPENCNEFLEEFINEYKILYLTDFKYNDHQFFVDIRAVICDSPARSYVTYTKGYTCYYGCSKCMEEGDYQDYRMRFLSTDAPIRTDDNFIKRVNEEHHLGKSKFEETEIGMVDQFPVEYMHLVCLEVEKKIIKSWTIKSWLQHASDRVKYANEKHQEPNKD